MPYPLLDPFHGQHGGRPNDYRRKEDPNGICREGLPLFHLKKICGNTPCIHSSARQWDHHKEHYPKESVFLDFAPRAFFGPLSHIDRRFFVETPSDQILVDVLQKKDHDRKHEHIGQKAGNEHQIFVRPLVDAIGYAHFGLPKR